MSPEGEKYGYGYGAAIQTTDGVIFNNDKGLYRLTCSSTSCVWNRMEQELQPGGNGGVMMYLPPYYSCEGNVVYTSYSNIILIDNES